MVDGYSGIARVCTGVQHASTFVLFLGVFVLLAALNTDPSPAEFVKLGVLLIVVGILGFVSGWLGRLFCAQGSST